MKLQNKEHVTGVPFETLQLENPSQYSLGFSSSSQNEPFLAKLRAKITETIKRKLRISASIVPSEHSKRIFEQHFSVKEGEKLLDASQCRISTTAGPILGHLFISTHKVAFCSEKPIKFSFKDENCNNVHYKVVIPVGKLSRANESRNMKRPSEKYIEIVTIDNFEFWFLEVRSFRKTLRYLQQAKPHPQYNDQ